MVKVLFIGLGSAGQRHLRNIVKIMGDDVQLIAYRVRGLTRVFDNNLTVVKEKNLASTYPIQEFSDLQQALNERPDVAIIANPVSMHLDSAITVAKAGVDLFIEKPISNTLEKVAVLKRIAEEKSLKVYVGYQNRLHPCVSKLREIYLSGVLGQIIAVHCEIGELLTRMHPFDDYRIMHEAQKKLGGGVVVCQSHEIDYLYWIFGLPKEIYSVGGKNSHLEIDVEDHATTLCRFEEKGYSFPAVIHQDFLQSPPSRKCKVIGEFGQIEIDLLKNVCCLSMYNDDVVIFNYDNFQRNDMFIDEMKLFFECVRTRGDEFVGLGDGINSLRLALAIKESMEKDQIIKLREMDYE